VKLHSGTSAIVNEIRKRAGAAKRIAFVSGNFNTVHPGHLRLLRFAAECGDFLVVGVNDDRSDGVMLPEELRLDGLNAIGFVDYAFILRDPPEGFIAKLKPAVVVKGKEHEARINPEQRALQRYGGRLLFGSGEMAFSSIDLLKREILEPNLSSIVRPVDFPRRHGFTFADLRATVAKFKGFRVAVIGDLIVDEYVACDPLGMSQEDPTLVVTPIQRERFIGGAAIVAAHAGMLGADVTYFTVAGRDETARFARRMLKKYGVASEVFEDDSRPTTLKQRYRAAGKTLLRVSHLRQHDITRQLVRSLAGAVKAALARSDLLIFSDFNYGCLPQSLVDEIVEFCKRRGLPMVADSQSSSQVGDVSRFKDMMLVTPTEREARLAVRDFNSGLVVLAEKLRRRARSKNVVLTLGAEGLLTHAPTTKRNEWLTDRLPSFNTSPKDTAGAGDSLLTCCSMAMALGAGIWQGAYLGCIAAACQVSRVGNIPLSPRDIEHELAD
jgi:rfaE bifunctional protein kinase chain/domain